MLIYTLMFVKLLVLYWFNQFIHLREFDTNSKYFWRIKLQDHKKNIHTLKV